MKDIDLSSMISKAQVVFSILEKEYNIFLKDEKKEWLENIKYENLFKITDKETLLPIFLSGDGYYLNKKILKEHNNIYENLLLFLCLSLLCGELNPLKIGLIELETRKLSNKYNIEISNTNNQKELEIATLIHDKILNDLPYNIIFLDSDIEIFHYLTIEKGIEVAKLYIKISNLMKQKYNDLDKEKINLETYINYYNNINYENILDIIYDYINVKIR